MTGAEEKIDVPHFDPVEHAARHRGIEAVTRLFELAKNATDQGLQRAAVSRGLELALKLPWSHHHDKLVSVAEALGLAEAEGEAARAVEEARASHERRMRDLDEEVQGANASLSKPRIFAAYRAMAEACAAAGDHHAAIKAYFTLKNHCSNPEEFAVLCRGIVVMSLQTRTHGHVATFSLRGRSSVGEDAESSRSEFACAQALVSLYNGDFTAAWNNFSRISLDLSDRFAEVVLGEDVALYGALSALASRPRAGLQEALDAWRVPLGANEAARDLLSDFVNARYRRCLRRLALLESRMKLDPYLRHRAEALVLKIRRRAVVQHMSVYSRVDLRTMAATFGVDLAVLESDLAALIAGGAVRARIDADAMVAVAREDDQRAEMLRKARTLRNAFVRDARRLELRVSLVQNRVVAGGRSTDRRPTMRGEGRALEDLTMGLGM